jgi:hypothetical protein
MQDTSRSRSVLSLGLALLLSAVATAPLWHAPHPSRVEPAVEKAHAHSETSTGLCNERSFAPDTECALCLTQRLLSTSITDQVDDSFGPPPEVGIQGELDLDTLAGDRFVLPARAPPLS